ncbi:hypothetical protein RQP46_000205 [Phenoliferia psychrophenolica]
MLPSSTASYTPLYTGNGKAQGRSSSWLTNLRRPVLFLPIGCATLLVLVFMSKSASLPASLHNSVDRIVSAGSNLKAGGGGKAGSGAGGEWDCNPFEAKGRLQVDVETPTNTKWVPFDTTCAPSSYMSSLWRADGDVTPIIPTAGMNSKQVSGGREYLPWLMNRTVVIHGDSIDRFHLKDFCALINGRLFVVSPDHPASPAPYRQPYFAVLDKDGEETEESKQAHEDREAREHIWEGRPRDGVELTSPWVCDVEEYGFTILSVFTFGLEGAENFFQTERWYYPPATWVDRLQAITMPLLEGLAKHLNRPEITTPDMVELNSGYWDLRRYTEEDFTAAGWTSRPYPEDSQLPYSNLSPEREQGWEREARKAIKEAARSFRGKDGSFRSGPALVWRALHQPPARHNYAPFPRVSALDGLNMKVIQDLQEEYASSHRGANRPQDHPDEGSAADDLGLDERLRVNNAGHLLKGQEHHFRDLLHPAALPGSYLWGDVMLYE